MKKIRDKKGKSWIFCFDGKSVPSYAIDQDIEQQIQRDMELRYFEDDIIQQFIIHLPFYTFPMWPKYKDQIKSPTDLCFCICLKCGNFISRAGSLCLAFYIIQKSDETYRIQWRPRLSCCDEICFNKTYAGTMTTVEQRLKAIFSDAANGFVDNLAISKTKCYVCEDLLPCNDEICKYVMDRVSSKTTPFERMFNLTTYFSEINLDIISALIPNLCCRYGCDKKMSTVLCTVCRNTAYCSKQCKNSDTKAHKERGCDSFLTIWNW